MPANVADSTLTTMPVATSARLPMSDEDVRAWTQRIQKIRDEQARLKSRQANRRVNLQHLAGMQDALVRAVGEKSLKDAKLPQDWHDLLTRYNQSVGVAQVGVSMSPLATTEAAVTPLDENQLRDTEFALLGRQVSQAELEMYGAQEEALVQAQKRLDNEEAEIGALISRIREALPKIELVDANAPAAEPVPAQDSAQLMEILDTWDRRRWELMGLADPSPAASPTAGSPTTAASDRATRQQQWRDLSRRLASLKSKVSSRKTRLLPDDAKDIRQLNEDYIAFTKAASAGQSSSLK